MMSNKFSLTLPSLSFKVANPSSFSFTDVKRTPFFSIPRRIRWSVFWTSRKVNVMKHKKEMARITSTASSLIVPPQLLAWEVRSTHDCWRAYQSTPSALPGRAIEPHSVAVLAGDEPVDHYCTSPQCPVAARMQQRISTSRSSLLAYDHAQAYWPMRP